MAFATDAKKKNLAIKTARKKRLRVSNVVKRGTTPMNVMKNRQQKKRQ